jgi:subtilisin family serine protease
MDTGIDYNHPDLGGGFGPGHRVAGGYDFVGDAYTGFPSTPHPDPDPMDCGGHGTHVAGILGANGGVVGVAPGVTFNAYRVFGCSGTTTGDIMLAAMERVLADGNQVLNMSIGSSYQWPNYPTARASDNLVNGGVVVVCSAGNAGANGLYSMSAPGVGKKSIGSASVDNTRVHLPAIRTGAGSLVGYAAMSGAPVPPTSGVFDVVGAGRACNADLPLPSGLPGKIALIVRGTCTFREKATNALNAGAASVLIYNSSPGIFFGTVGTPALSRPVAGISREDGQMIVSQLPTTVEWTPLFGDSAVPTGGLISSFSSFGASPDLSLKPDISAPGGFIFSTVPLARGGYGVNSGTSMSSPHVAGSAALLLEAHPSTPSQVVRDILQNSASPRLWFGNPGLGLIENTHRQGAGLININAAIGATTKVTPGKLSLGETEAGPVTRTLTIENKGASDATYDLSNQPALATGNRTFSVQFFQGAAGVSFSSSTLTVPAGTMADVDITFSEPAGLGALSLFGGFIVIAPQGGGPVVRVPYSGLKGDYQSVLVLNPAALTFGNPLLRPENTVGVGGPVTITKDKPAFILVHLDHQVRRLRLEAFSTSGPALGRLAEFGYVGRSATQNEYFSLAWDGADPRSSGYLANGTYYVRLSVQKALGDNANPAHWETWTSPVITVDRTGGEPLPEPLP